MAPNSEAFSEAAAPSGVSLLLAALELEEEELEDDDDEEAVELAKPELAVADAMSSEPVAVADWDRTAVVSARTALLAAAVPVAEESADLVCWTGEPTLMTVEGVASPPVALALSDADELESELLESKPDLASASAMAAWGTSHLAWMGPRRSASLVCAGHHWFMQMVTSERNLSLAFSHMQSTSVGAHPDCLMQLVMQVGYAACACTREPPTRAAYRICCLDNILNIGWMCRLPKLWYIVYVCVGIVFYPFI